MIHGANLFPFSSCACSIHISSFCSNMKKGSPSLNPYAASYVPLFKRGAADLNQGFNSVQELNALPQGQHQHTSHSYAHSGGVIQTAEFPKFQDHCVGEPFASTSQYPNESPEKSNLDEYFDMDLAYLQMTFPGISEESLSDVYLANRCDLDSAIDMLHQLEVIY